MKIKLQGTIVSPDYDCDFFSSWIDRGIITPSSRIVSAVEGATEPFDVYINSYGGDVFAGGEMQIALTRAAAEGKIRTCEVGSIAASMAANIVAALRAIGVEVTAHVNSQLMYHGCYTATIGGAQHHEDVAASLRGINECVIANLKRCGVDECRAWFSEGREKWIDAREGFALGLFNSIAETDAQAPAEAKHTAARLAAFASKIKSRTEYQTMIDETIKAKEPVEAAPGAPKTEEQAAPAAETHPDDVAKGTFITDEAFEAKVAEAAEALSAALANERFASLQAKHDKLISDLTMERDDAREDLAKANADATSLRAYIEKLKADLAEVRDQLARSEQNREAVVTSAIGGDAKRDDWSTRYRATKRPY